MCAHEVACWETGKVYPTVAAVAEETGTSRTSVQRAIAGGRELDGRHWYYASMPRPRPEHLFWSAVPIGCIETGQSWECAKAACHFFKARSETIMEAVRMKEPLSGMHLCYLFDSGAACCPVMCVETGRVYESAFEAAVLLHIPEPNSILDSIRRGVLCFGFHFDYENARGLASDAS